MIPALRRRLARVLHRLANAIGPDRWLPTPSMEQEAKAEFGLRNVDRYYPMQPWETREILPAPGPGKAWVWNGGPMFERASYDLVNIDNVLPMKERK